MNILVGRTSHHVNWRRGGKGRGGEGRVGEGRVGEGSETKEKTLS